MLQVIKSHLQACGNATVKLLIWFCFHLKSGLLGAVLAALIVSWGAGKARVSLQDWRGTVPCRDLLLSQSKSGQCSISLSISLDSRLINPLCEVMFLPS